MVTGGDSGIGRAATIAFAREGADVLIAYLDQHADAEDTLRLVESAGRRAIAVAGDIGDEAHCKALIDRARDELGRIDVLVNNAATQRTRDTIEEIPTDEWERILRTNLTAPFWLCREAVGRDGTWRIHHQCRLDPGIATVPVAARVRHDKGRARDILKSPIDDARAARNLE